MERVVSREDAEKALKGMIAIMDSLDLAGCLLDNELEQFYNFNSIINDYIKGWAGNGEPIALVEVYYYTPNNIRPYKKAKYKVNNYGWQYDTEKTNKQDGYAGVKGVPITKFRICID